MWWCRKTNLFRIISNRQKFGMTDTTWSLRVATSDKNADLVWPLDSTGRFCDQETFSLRHSTHVIKTLVMVADDCWWKFHVAGIIQKEDKDKGKNNHDGFQVYWVALSHCANKATAVYDQNTVLFFSFWVLFPTCQKLTLRTGSAAVPKCHELISWEWDSIKLSCKFAGVLKGC